MRIFAFKQTVRRLARDESGVSAIEFGLVAPLIFFSMLAVVDVGFALRERMSLDHVLRSGAQAAMRDRGEAAVLATLTDSGPRPGVTFDPPPDRYCVCPTTGVVDPNCTLTCPVQPQKFYLLSASQTYDGIFLPAFNFAPSLLVEVQ